MEKLEYKKAVQELQEAFENKKILLAREYATTNSPYKLGDIFQDHLGRIRIEQIKVTTSFGESYPSCIYFGTEINKDGSDNKKGNKRQCWQDNEEKL